MLNSPGALLITGASGFIGRHLVLALCDRFQLFCLARRSQKEAEIQSSPNIHWIQADISEPKEMHRVSRLIPPSESIASVLHLAGYYDFSQKDNPAYELTNVQGTKNVLDLAHILQAKQFIFSSSLAACEFTPPGQVVDESTPVSADFPYARSKRRAEEIIDKHKGDMQACIIRLAAVYSDWCEFPPLYSLLQTWLSPSLLSRALGGRGEFAIPYIHVNDVIDALCIIMTARANIPAYGVYNFSPNGATSHKALFQAATKYHFVREHKAFHIPKLLAWCGLHVQNLLFRMVNKEPFESPWMAKYIDKQLNINADLTYQRLGWKPTPRYQILRRLLFLVENRWTHPNNWRLRNENMISQRVPQRRSMLIHKALQESREKVVSDILKGILRDNQSQTFSTLASRNPSFVTWFTYLMFQVLSFSIRTRDRYILSDAVQVVAPYCFDQGYSEDELKNFMFVIQRVLNAHLLGQSELKKHKQRIRDFIDLNTQFLVDEIEDVYESLSHKKMVRPETVKQPPAAEMSEIQRFARRIESLCGDPMMETALFREYGDDGNIWSK
ncbi:MAG: NAD-dependent epimerase/dehydratase family protein [Desulfovermiculus sp.]|nr:NAD-dependent epimerase/dehydratase family protein [Desulfovermiculus sp.]